MIVLGLVLMLWVFVWGRDSDSGRRTIIIGGDYDFPPYEYLDENQQPAGYNVDLVKAISAKMNFQAEFRLGKWSRVKDWLEKGEIEVVGGMAYSQERAEEYEFSLPHTETWRSFFIQKKSAYKSVSDLQNSVIAMQKGDIAEAYLKSVKYKGIKIYTPTQEDALLLLAQGKCDAAICTYRHGTYLLEKMKLKNIKTLDMPFAPNFYCFAAKRPNMLLIDEFNTGLAILKQTGEYRQIYQKWFGDERLDFISREVFNRKFIYILLPLIFVLIIAVFWVLYLRSQIKKKTIALQQEFDERMKYEGELSREFKMFVNGPVIVYKMQPNPNKIRYISQNIDQFGYSADDFVSHKLKFKDIVFSEDLPRVETQLAEDIEHNRDFIARQFRLVTADGQLCWVFDYALLVKDESDTHWLYGYLLDITSQKALEAELLEAKERAEAANIAKGHFLANISHEIRTPLNGIIGFIQVLQKTELTIEQQEFLDLIYTSGKNLMKIVNDILDFSRMESGTLDLVGIDFNPRYLVDDIIKTFVSTEGHNKVELRSRINEQVPPLVNGDMIRLRQIFINLMQNALKFTEKGYVEITADIYSHNNEEIRILFAVKDTGSGIDKMKQRDIFEHFLQSDPAIIRKYGGTGLGLSIVKKLVELMGGFIWVESEQGKGSSFFFIVPLKVYAEKKQFIEHVPQASEYEKTPLPEMKILLVEDDPINQLVTKKQLERWKLSVQVAANGKEALNLVENENFDSILMDVQMAEMDGITATNLIRELEKDTGKHTYIIAFTAAAMAGDRERFIAAGMDEYISKPIDIDQLYNILGQIKTNP